MLEWLFRPQCVACTQPAPGPFCPACEEALVEAPVPLSDAATPTIVAPWQFGGPLAIAIRRLKFTGRTHVARDLAPLWAPLLAAAAGDTGVVVPIPLHWRRRMLRGFDQTWLLAHHACHAASLARPQTLLRRVRWTPPQSTLAAVARRDNLIGAFAVTDPRAIAGRTVVVVDDVVTTGSTLAEAAATLRAAGAAQVIGIALARS